MCVVQGVTMAVSGLQIHDGHESVQVVLRTQSHILMSMIDTSISNQHSQTSARSTCAIVLHDFI